MAWASRSMFVIWAFGRALAKRKDVNGNGPEPMNAIERGDEVDIDSAGDGDECVCSCCCWERAARMFDSSRFTRSM